MPRSSSSAIYSAKHIEESLTALAEKIRQSQILMFPGGFSAGDEPDGSAKFIATIIRSPRVADAIMDLLKNRDGLILGICNGFQALIKTGLVPYGEIREPAADSPTLVHNDIGRHISCYANTRVVSTLSPWLSNSQPGDIHAIPLLPRRRQVLRQRRRHRRTRQKRPDRHPVLRRKRRSLHGHRHQPERLARRHRRHHQPLRPRPRQNGPHRTRRLASRQKHPRQQTPAALQGRRRLLRLLDQRVLTVQVRKRREIAIRRPQFLHPVMEADRGDPRIVNLRTLDHSSRRQRGEFFKISRTFSEQSQTRAGLPCLDRRKRRGERRRRIVDFRMRHDGEKFVNARPR